MCFGVHKKPPQRHDILWLFGKDQIEIFESLCKEEGVHLIYVVKVVAAISYDRVDVLDRSVATVDTRILA